MINRLGTLTPQIHEDRNVCGSTEMLCRECNAQVSDDSRFCSSFGISLKDKTDNLSTSRTALLGSLESVIRVKNNASNNASQDNPTTLGDTKAFASENHNSYTAIDRRLEEPINDAVRNIIASPIKQSISSPPKNNEEQMSQLRRIKEIGDIGATVSGIVFL